MAVQVVFDAAVILGMAWFVLQRTRPVLVQLEARPRAMQLAFGATAVAIIAVGAHLIGALAGSTSVALDLLRLAGGFVWILVVGLGYPQYRFLRHATGTKRPGT